MPVLTPLFYVQEVNNTLLSYQLEEWCTQISLYGQKGIFFSFLFFPPLYPLVIISVWLTQSVQWDAREGVLPYHMGDLWSRTLLMGFICIVNPGQ